MANMFYFCSECNKKYKTERKIRSHLLQDHHLEVVALAPPKEFVSAEKRSKEEKKLQREEEKRQREEQMARLVQAQREIENARSQIDEDIERIQQRRQHLQQAIEIQNRQNILPVLSNQNQQERSECAICMENEKNTVFVPCGHMQSCYSCAQEIKNRNGICPICRGYVTMITRVFQ